MPKIIIKILSICFIFALSTPSMVGKAQNTPTAGPVYIVQEGDSLWDIAYRFHVSQDELVSANGIVNTNQISIGQQLVIPGLGGIQGILTTQTVAYGETLHSLSLRNQISTQMLKRLNHITNPDELYVGYSLIVLQNSATAFLGKRVSLGLGQSILELSILNHTDPWTIMADNNVENSWVALPGEVLRTPGEDDNGPGALPPTITSVIITGLTQGQTAEIQVEGGEGLRLGGTLIKYALNIFPEGNNHYTALQGIHAMVEPGLYPLTLQSNNPDDPLFSYSQLVMVQAGDFVYDRSLPVDPVTLDPETNRTENELWSESSAPVSPEKLWNGIFSSPVGPYFTECYTSRFGNRRSYNGGPYLYFHTGLDFCGQVGDPIYSAAPGIVVFAGPLTVRGKATMIDHGRGIYTAYMHQSEILVNVGDRVEQGQLIGKVGNTGRVEGPHLHFEVLVGGIQVDPLEWLNQEFP